MKKKQQPWMPNTLIVLSAKSVFVSVCLFFFENKVAIGYTIVA